MKIRLVLAASAIAATAFVAGPANASNFLGFHMFQEDRGEKISHSDQPAKTPRAFAPDSGRSTEFFAKESPRVTFANPVPAAQAVSPVTEQAVSAVPEPTTWAMFLLGFGAMGWMLRAVRRNPGRGTFPSAD